METSREEELTLRIYDIARGGAGVAKEESGSIVFVPFTAPGDLVRVKILKREKNYVQAQLIEILEASAQRVEPPCPVFSVCGGCEWQHIPYKIQWEKKIEGLKHALKRMNIVTNDQLVWLEFPAMQIWNYRNRAQFRGFQNEIGFFERGSKKLVPINECKIVRHEINMALGTLKDEGKKFSKPYKLEIEVHADGTLAYYWNSAHGAGGFRQVHEEQNKKLQEWVFSACENGDELFDLYGGAGNLSLGLCDSFKEIYCVDIGSPEDNPPLNTPGNVHFFKSTVRPWINKAAKDFQKKQKLNTGITKLNRVAILDPPREGMGSDHNAITESIEALGIQKIALIGCDVDSWTRDLHRFQKRGWEIIQLGAIDLFPQTHHVEALAVLQKK